MIHFRDIDGKPILPGSKVIIATTKGRYSKRPTLRRGVVYRTSIKLAYDGTPYSYGTVGVIVDVPFEGLAKAGSEVKMGKERRTYRTGQNILVVE